MSCLSSYQCWQADCEIIAERHDGFQRHVAGALCGPLVILLKQQGADQYGDGLLIRKDPDDIATPLDLVVQPLDRVGRV